MVILRYTLLSTKFSLNIQVHHIHVHQSNINVVFQTEMNHKNKNEKKKNIKPQSRMKTIIWLNGLQLIDSK